MLENSKNVRNFFMGMKKFLIFFFFFYCSRNPNFPLLAYKQEMRLNFAYIFDVLSLVLLKNVLLIQKGLVFFLRFPLYPLHSNVPFLCIPENARKPEVF